MILRRFPDQDLRCGMKSFSQNSELLPADRAVPLTLTCASSVLVGRTATHRWKTVFVQFDRQHPVDAVRFLRWNPIPDYDTYHNEGRLTPV